jgi:beta-lactamase regulating signal transducer with metallopeptidase domain
MPLWFSNLVAWSAQVASLGLVAGLLLRLFQIRDPRIRLAFLRGLLLASLALPIAQPWPRLPIISPTPAFPNGSVVYSISAASVVARWHFPSMPILAEWIGIALSVGIVVRFALLAVGLVRLRRLRLTSMPVASDEPSAAILSQMLARVGARAEFRLSADVDSPVTFGVTNPVVLLPENFLAIEPRLQSVIACHELLHAVRRDWTQHLTEEIVCALFWFHPAILWLVSRIRIAREQLVDLEVVRLTNARKDYLQALVEFTRRGARIAVVPAPPFLTRHQLVERISLISKEVHMSRRRLLASLAVISGCLFIVVGLSAWSFPLKRAPLQSESTSSNIITPGGPSDGISGGVSGGVAGGINSGVVGGTSGSVPGERTEVPAHTSSDIPQVDLSSIWIDTVARGPMVRQVRGLGTLVQANGSTNLIARITVPAFLTADVKPGQNSSVESREGHVASGHVISVGSSGSLDKHTIDIAIDTVPETAKANLEIDCTVDIEKIDDTLYVHRPIHSGPNKEIPIFRLDSDGKEATRTQVKFGRASVNTIEVLAGLKAGDQIILSDMSQVGDAERIRLTGQYQPGR